MSWRKVTSINSVFNLDTVRHTLYSRLKNIVHSEFRPSMYDMVKVWSDLSDKLALCSPPYGLAERNDFGDYTDLLAHIFAYNNKQYYIYRAISNDSKIGFLSRKQYYKMKMKMDIMLARNCTEGSICEYRKSYCDKNGKAASPFRMFKGAIIENPKMKFFDNPIFFKVMDAHERTIKRSDIAETIINILFNSSTPITLEETDDIQQCYDVSLPDSYDHSAARYCTHSCMEGCGVGDFYKSFPVKGVLVKNGKDNVGRFLLWTLPDGKQYVDRLYIRTANAKTALAAIDKKYPEAIKYPALTDKSDNPKYFEPLPFYALPIKDVDKFINCRTFAWVDTFAHIIRDKDTDTYYITNTRRASLLENSSNRFKYIWTMRGGTPHREICPDCGKLLLGSLEPENYNYLHKLLHCKEYKAKGHKEPIYVALLKEYIENIGGKDDNGKNKSKQELETLLGL